MTDADIGNPYNLLSVEHDANDKQIQAAWRKSSRDCHPDRHPDDPAAAEKFNLLTRARDFLLNTIKRAEFDRKLKHEKAKKERDAFIRATQTEQEAKRRKLQEDLEAREEAARGSANAVFRDYAASFAKAGGASPFDLEKARLRVTQIDFARRIAAKEDELSEQVTETAHSAEKERISAQQAKIEVTWKAKPATTSDLAKLFEPFGLVSLEMSVKGAVVLLRSREDALKAMLRFREAKKDGDKDFPFKKVRLANADANDTDAKPNWCSGEIPKKAPQDRNEIPQKGAKKSSAFGCGAFQRAASTAQRSASQNAFDDWESDMLSRLSSAAAKQKEAKP